MNPALPLTRGAGAAARQAAPAGTTVHIGRQPVFDADERLYGYELLFRPSATATASGVGVADGDAATTTTILAAFSEFGAADLLGGGVGFLNLTRAFLVGDLPVPFEPGNAVLEVLETITVDDAVVAGAERLRAAGYRLALDDFVWTPEAARLLPLADIVKVDVLGLPWETVLDTVRRCRPHGVTLLAERVEDAAMLQRCRAEGFELFQGYHLGRPQTLSADSVTGGQAAALQLLALLSDPEADLADVDELLRHDPALTVRLLKIANSAAYGRQHEVSTIRDAVMLVGLARLRGWLVLVGMSGGRTTPVMLVDALALARSCELLARASDGVRPDIAFTLGLLTGVAASLGTTPGDLAAGLPPLGQDLQSALLAPAAPPRGDGSLRDVLDAVLAYRSGDVAALLAAGVDPAGAGHAYLEGVSWAEATCRAVAVDAA